MSADGKVYEGGKPVADPKEAFGDFKAVGIYEEKYGFTIPLRVQQGDSINEIRKMVNAATKALSAPIMRHLLTDPRPCDIDLRVTIVPQQ